LLDGAASDTHRRAQRRTRAEQLTDLDAVRAPNRRTDISALLDPDEVAGLLAGEVVGQSRAIQTVSRQVCEHLAQCEPRRPLSIFAVGPSGVGKTAAAERLAEVVGELSGRPWGFIRLDMNEYREHHRISQFLGAPAGYVGHRDATPLADLFNRHQAAVILFDEIDKAHPDVMIALMAALDAGRLTMGDGHTIDLRRSVLIFTSNGHADPILERVTGDMTEIEVDSVCRQELLTGGTWPALVGRIRSHVLFGPLDERASAEVAVLAIERAGTAFGLRVAVIDPGVVTALLGHSADLGLGVRRFEHDAAALLGAAFVDHLRLGSTDDNVAVRWVDGSVVVEPTAPVPTNEEVDSERI
jgi:ATP-dependent Clp protease ATP-binding subunit ClpB